MSEMDGQQGKVIVPRPQAGEMQSSNGMSTSVQRSGELASQALATQARAAIEARYVMAMQRPRDLMKVRDRLLQDAKRPAFAKEAIYHKPIGKGVEGPSIRLAEAAVRAMGNIYCPVFAIYDDAETRVIRVTATDLETNVTFDKDVTVRKTVERNNLQQGQSAIASRIGARGQMVYIVEASDDDILNKENALASKAMRECALRLIPGDIKAEVLDACRETTRKNIADDPDAEQKRMCDAFRECGVSIDQLKEYLGHPIEQTTVPELTTMRALYLALKDEETTWREIMAGPRPDGETPPPQTTATTGNATTGKITTVTAAAEAAKARREGSQAGPPAEKTPAPKQESLPTAKAKVQPVPPIPVDQMNQKERAAWDAELAKADPSGGVIK
jgi:hypothetical protein